MYVLVWCVYARSRNASNNNNIKTTENWMHFGIFLFHIDTFYKALIIEICAC